ncbi:alpha-L-fucosidase [Parapedobacter composti]|uniref:alpha-L-fucosidase n=1 Tax=Parapedobacter composti TaxID=623281 RepID=UPI001B8C819C|nr:alpha-L-fucosidase [Parapedobacter composti]
MPAYLSEYKQQYNKNPREANLTWFKEAKFGMFIHYGLYSLVGKGEWIQLLDTIPLDEYGKLQHRFTAESFDAERIVLLAKNAGMRYITFTTKHHDGFCLFDTKQTEFNSMRSPAKRDLVAELAAACRKHGLGLFLYYSYAADWKHPYFYPPEAGWKSARPAYRDRPEAYLYREPADFRHYIEYVHNQLTELLTQYPDIAGIWLDPIMGYYSKPDLFPIAETYALIRRLSPHALISFKQGANGEEDFVAPERGATAKVGEQLAAAKLAAERNRDKPVEICNTMQRPVPGTPGGATWGYNKALDGNHLTAADIKRLRRDAEQAGANLLLNIGPLPDGAVHPEDAEALSSLKQ